MKINIKKQISKSKNFEGVTSLAVALLLGGIILEIGLVIALVSYYLNASTYGIRLSAEALSAAKSGIDDGLLKIVRGVNNDNYSLAVGNASSEVDISCIGACLVSELRQITSTGSILSKKRILIAIIEVSTTTRQLKITSVRESKI